MNETISQSPIRAQIAHAATIPWGAALAQVRQHDAGLDRMLCSPAELGLDRDKLYVGDLQLSLDEEGMRRLFGALHAPAEYVACLSPSLRTQILEFHLNSRGSEGLSSERAVVLSRNGCFSGIDRADLHRLTGPVVLETVGEAIDGNTEVEVQNLNLRQDAFQIDIVSPRLTEDARVGDTIRYGLRVRHSLVGEYATTVESFALRLACTNGLIQRECIGAKGTARSRPRTRRLPADHGDADKKQREQIRELTKAAWKRLRDVASGIRKLHDRPFDMDSLARFLRQARMYSARLNKLVEAAWRQEGSEGTAFGFLNALTRVATHDVSFSQQQRRRLELVAGIFSGQVAHLCPRCFGLIA